jgi:hypothetical protein
MPSAPGTKPATAEASAEAQLASFLAKFTPEVATRAEAILARMRKQFPHAIEMVYDNYNALAIGFGPTERPSEAIVSIAVYPRWVSLFFLQARGLPDPQSLLKGKGTVARHIVLPDPSTLGTPAIQALFKAAADQAKVPFARPKKGEPSPHRLIIKSVSAKQRPRR